MPLASDPTLGERLRARIAADGPIPFEVFMQAALYDPEFGFFSAGPVRSVKEGDFLTSPEVSPWFGRTLARFVAAERTRVLSAGERAPFIVVDVGAGSGSLLRAMMEELEDAEISFVAVEISRPGRDSLAGDVAAYEDMGDLPNSFDGVVIANELLDNLPTALAVRTGRRWEERWVGLEEGGLALVAEPARDAVTAWCDRFAGNVPEGGLVEVQLEAGQWVAAVVGRLRRGSVVVIDYGGTAEELEPRRTQGTLRTYRAHHLGPDPLLEPGATDITADVNFTALQAAAEGSGASVEIRRQDAFLSGLGLATEVRRLRYEELELARGDDEMARLQVRSERTDAETLLHPRGLGDFRVMVARVL